MLTHNDTSYLTARQTADRLGLHLGSLANQRQAGRSAIPFVCFAGRILYAVDDVEAYQNRNRI